MLLQLGVMCIPMKSNKRSKADFTIRNICSFYQYFGRHRLPSSVLHKLTYSDGVNEINMRARNLLTFLGRKLERI